MAKTPEKSEFTSIKQRIDAVSQQKYTSPCLDEFIGIKKGGAGIPFRLADYIELVEWTGRIIHPTKRGFIKQNEPSLMERLSLDQDAWITLTTQFEQQFSHWVGSELIVRQLYSDHQYQRIPSTRTHKSLLS
jgi:hypothetical protein